MKHPSPLAAALLALAGCADDGATAVASATPRVVASFHPAAFFTAYVAGDLVSIATPVPHDADPASWEPTPDALVELQRADLIVLNGAGFEHWAESVSLPESRVLRMSDGFRDEWLEQTGGSHSHGGLAPHSHEGVDGHTWMDPRLAIRQAEAIASALKTRWPEHAAAFDEGFARLRSELEALDARWRAVAPRLASTRLVASHPSYDYLARRYGFEIESLDLDPEAPLADETLAALVELASGAERTLLLWESEPLPATRATLAARGITSVVLSPAEAQSPDERERGHDFLDVMNDNLDRLTGAVDA